MRLYFIVCVGVAYSFSALGQYIKLPVWHQWQDTTFASRSHVLSFDLSNGIYSNTMSNELVNHIYKQGFLPDDLKERQIDRLATKNRLGFELSAGMQYAWKSRSKPMIFHVGLFNKDIRSYVFTDDVLKLFFLGNQPFLGQKLDLEVSIRQLLYQGIEFGIDRHWKDKGIWIGVYAQILKGGYLQHMTVRNGSFFTAADASSITLQTDLDWYRTPKLDNAITQSAGTGAAASLHLGKVWDDNKQSVTFSATDIGLIRYQQLPRYTSDSTFTFKGLEIDDVFDFSADSVKLFGDKNGDLRNILSVKESKKNTSIYIPATVQFMYQRMINERFRGNVGVRYTTGLFIKPLVFCQVNWTIAKGWGVAPLISVGGFGRVEYGLSLQKRVGTHAMLSIDSFYQEALLAPRKTSTQGMFLKGAWYF